MVNVIGGEVVEYEIMIECGNCNARTLVWCTKLEPLISTTCNSCEALVNVGIENA